MPRKTKLTPDTQQRIVDALSTGATHRLACQYGGIAVASFTLWMSKGEKGLAPYSAFSVAVKKAEAQAGVRWLAQINQAAQAGTWVAAAWLLERRWPQEYGRRVTEHAGSPDAPMTIKVEYPPGLSGLLHEAQALLVDDGTLPEASRG